MQDKWLSEKADAIQAFADKKDMKNVYSALKVVYGPTSSGSIPLFSADGSTLISDKEKILKRWAEHFNSVLNRPSTINDEAIARLPQVPVDDTLVVPPTVQEVTKDIKRLSNGKAPGADSIPAEIYASGGPKLIESITSLFKLKDASIIHFYKRKRNRNVCDNDRGISLLSIAGKILQPLQRSLGTRRAPREPVWFSRGTLYCRYDLRSSPTTGEVSVAERRFVHHLRGPHESF